MQDQKPKPSLERLGEQKLLHMEFGRYFNFTDRIVGSTASGGLQSRVRKQSVRRGRAFGV